MRSRLLQKGPLADGGLTPAFSEPPQSLGQTLSQNATTQSSQTACFAGMRKIASLIVARSAGGQRAHTDAIFFGNVGHVGIYTRCRPMLACGK